MVLKWENGLYNAVIHSKEADGMANSVDSNLTALFINIYTVASRYLDFGYLEQPLISKRQSDPCFNIQI